MEIKIEGNLHLPQDITYIQGIVNTTSGVWFTFQGTNVHISGTSNVSTGWIECELHAVAASTESSLLSQAYGQAWWDGNVVNGTGMVCYPGYLFLYYHTLMIDPPGCAPSSIDLQCLVSNVCT